MKYPAKLIRSVVLRQRTPEGYEQVVHEYELHVPVPPGATERSTTSYKTPGVHVDLPGGQPVYIEPRRDRSGGDGPSDLCAA